MPISKMDEKYFSSLKIRQHDYRLNFMDMYHLALEVRPERELYKKLAEEFLYEHGNQLTIDEAYKQLYHDRPGYFKFFPKAKDEDEIRAFLLLQGKTIPCLDICDGSPEKWLTCYFMDEDLTLDYFDPIHRWYFGDFFCIRINEIDAYLLQDFLNYHLYFHFNDQKILFHQFLNNIVARNGYITDSKIRCIEKWIEATIPLSGLTVSESTFSEQITEEYYFKIIDGIPNRPLGLTREQIAYGLQRLVECKHLASPTKKTIVAWYGKGGVNQYNHWNKLKSFKPSEKDIIMINNALSRNYPEVKVPSSN